MNGGPVFEALNGERGPVFDSVNVFEIVNVER